MLLTAAVPYMPHITSQNDGTLTQILKDKLTPTSSEIKYRELTFPKHFPSILILWPRHSLRKDLQKRHWRNYMKGTWHLAWSWQVFDLPEDMVVGHILTWCSVPEATHQHQVHLDTATDTQITCCLVSWHHAEIQGQPPPTPNPSPAGAHLHPTFPWDLTTLWNIYLKSISIYTSKIQWFTLQKDPSRAL